MLQLTGKALAFGVIGAVCVPIAVFFMVLVAAHVFDPRCGTPGDSGGCEMGAAAMAIAAVLPGLAIGVAVALFQAWRKRAR
jgi:hypothetical protein